MRFLFGCSGILYLIVTVLGGRLMSVNGQKLPLVIELSK